MKPLPNLPWPIKLYYNPSKIFWNYKTSVKRFLSACQLWAKFKTMPTIPDLCQVQPNLTYQLHAIQLFQDHKLQKRSRYCLHSKTEFVYEFSSVTRYLLFLKSKYLDFKKSTNPCKSAKIYFFRLFWNLKWTKPKITTEWSDRNFPRRNIRLDPHL